MINLQLHFTVQQWERYLSFYILKCWILLISIFVLHKSALVLFKKKQNLKYINIQTERQEYLHNFFYEKGLKSTIVNQTCNNFNKVIWISVYSPFSVYYVTCEAQVTKPNLLRRWTRNCSGSRLAAQNWSSSTSRSYISTLHL